MKNEELEAHVDTLQCRVRQSESDRHTWLLELEQMQRRTETQDSIASIGVDDASDGESPFCLAEEEHFAAGGRTHNAGEPGDASEQTDDKIAGEMEELLTYARMLCRSGATRSSFTMEESPEETKPEKTYQRPNLWRMAHSMLKGNPDVEQR
eukprot:GEMP01085533.1.p1 GENE.GEMP01085533.1~~GEMP01085533.1.p1  ORF type:complete len:152 (+),score=54.70 GEMP01085533.1:487-942(+)